MSVSVMNVQWNMDVYCLIDSDGDPLPPSIQAAVLAKYSRSPHSARHILSELTEEKSNKFHDKWTVGYGHSSVAELASVAMCIEGISIVASKIVESMPRAAYSEKSTRYQKFSSESFIVPPGAPQTMKKFARRLYEAYDRFHDPMIERCAMLMGMDPHDPQVLKRREVRARAFDNIRYLLPAGTGTNVGVVMNVRDAQEMIAMMADHRNPEVRAIGEEIKKTVSKTCPSLIRHVTPTGFFLPEWGLGPISAKYCFNDPSWYVDIHQPHLLADPLQVQKSMESFIADRHAMSWSAFCAFMNERPEHAAVPDIFKKVRLTFDVLMDYGAFRDLQRHRRCDQFIETLNTTFGYVIPDDIAGSDLEGEYREIMDSVRSYSDDVMDDPDLSQYVIPLGYLHRSLFQMDLKELYYVVELRTRDHGHISYRRVAYEMFNLAKQRHPQLMQWCRAVKPDAIGIHR